MIMIPEGSNLFRRKTKVGRGAKTPKNLEDRYGRTLRAAVDAVFVQRVRELMEAYESGRSVEEVQRIADSLQVEASNALSRIANNAVPDWFSAVNQYAANKFERSIRDALGIDAQSILSQSVYDTIRTQTINANVGLIKTFSNDFYGEVVDAILTDYQGIGFSDGSKSLAGRIQNMTINGNNRRTSHTN